MRLPLVCTLLFLHPAPLFGWNNSFDLWCEVHEQQNQTWALVWHDEFDSGNLTEWQMEHEINSCGGNGIQMVSCNTFREENVRVVNGYLVLEARHENYAGNEFTAATITTRRNFTHGRYEIRAAVPAARWIRVSIFTRIEHEAYWHENGQIDLMANVGELRLHRGIHYADSRDKYQASDFLISPGQNLHDFHLYGIEWDDKQARFFFDSIFSVPIFFNQKNYLKPFQQIRLQIGVGGMFFNKPIPENFEDMQWTCPAFIIDYVRVFRKVNPLNESIDILSQCQVKPLNVSTVDEDQKMKNLICPPPTIVDLATSQISKSKILYIAVAAVVILFIGLLVYLVVQIAKIRQQVEQGGIGLQASVYGRTNSNFEMYEQPMYDEIELDYKPIESYTHMNRVTNEYLDLQPAPNALPSDYLVLSGKPPTAVPSPPTGTDL